MKYIYNLKIIFLTIVTLCYASRNPVILVPGDGGAQLEAKLNKTSVVHYICQKTTNDYFNIWLNLELLVPLIIDCWIDNIKLIYNNKTRTTRSPDGVSIRVPGFGITETVEWLDPSHSSSGAYFNEITNALVSIGYVRNASIRGAPYDFRKGPNENQEYFVKLKKLIEDTYADNNNTAVAIVAHSMGGLMAQYFLGAQTKAWKRKFIARLVTIAAPWGGSMKALKVYAIGDNLGSSFLRESVMRQEQITSPSLAWLLPSKLFWKSDEILIQTTLKNYTIDDLEDFFKAISFPNGWEMRKDIEPYQTKFKAPDVELHCLYGTKVSTVQKLSYKPGSWLNYGYPNLVLGDGDGTVNLKSLQGCQYFRNMQKKKVYIKEIPNAEHLKILHDETTIEYISTLMLLNKKKN